MSDDDVYEKFQCAGNTFASSNVNILFIESGNFLIGVARCIAFMMFLALQRYNKILMRRKQANNVNVIKGLILPSYLPFIYFYMLYSITTGVIEILNQAFSKNPSQFDWWVYPIEIGITHWFLEGLAIFLMRYGAGFVAMRRSFRASFVWAAVTFLFYFLIFSLFYDRFSKDDDNQQLRANRIFGVFITYESLMFIFYTAYGFLPASVLYHRPALTFYARFNALSYLVVILFASLYYKGDDQVICPGSVIAFIFAAFLQPLAIYKTLQIDSQYWQGLSPEPGNPLTEVWDHLGIETASSLAENMETFGRYNTKLPILHFGLMNFDQDLKFVAGGFSRVYFGSLRDERVAFKILFAMELDPKDIEEFYREAAVLHKLKHPNVVQCKGVCVMPPALTIVLELCKYGSLFDFLYKAPALPLAKQRLSFGSRMRNSIMGGRNSIMDGRPTEIEMMTPAAFAAATASAAEDAPNGNSSRFDDPDDEEDDEGEFVNNPISSTTNNNINNNTANNNNNMHNSSNYHSNKSQNSSSSNNKPFRASLISAAIGGPTQIDLERGSLRSTTASIRGSPVPTPLRSLSRGNSGTLNNNNTGSGGSSNVRMDSTATNSGTRNRNLATIMHDTFMGNTGTTSDTPTPAVPAQPPLTLGASLSFRKRLLMMRDAAAGIAHLHAQGYMHCDIKSLNFLVAEDFVLKLADMGEARLITSPPKRDTPPIPAMNWAPPEVLPKGAAPEVYTVASDVYGLSIVLAEIINAELPFGEQPNRVSMAAWYDILTIGNLRPPLPDALPASLIAIINKGWSTNPEERCTAQEILTVIDEFVIPGDGVV
eukprot:gene9734-11440_t